MFRSALTFCEIPTFTPTCWSAPKSIFLACARLGHAYWKVISLIAQYGNFNIVGNSPAIAYKPVDNDNWLTAKNRWECKKTRLSQ